MNQGIYKLVFSKVRGAMMVVAEIASSRAGDGQRRARRGAMLWLALSVMPGPWMVMTAWAELPSGVQIRDAINVDGVIKNAAGVDMTRVISSSASQ
ncbi:MAG TPA: ESPR domain-containing protein, partial [Methylophilus sp.]